MALRNQPYLPLYIQDFLTDEKLIECSAESTGVYIRLLCILHKTEEYGKLLLKQKDKQTDKQIKNFALKLLKQMPYTIDVIERSLKELFDEGVINIENDFLYQKRMVKDNDISLKRSDAGKTGGEKTQSALAKFKANAEDEDENENINKDKKEKNIGNFILPEKIKPEIWEAYLEMRKVIKKPATRHAQNLIIKKLSSMKDDPNLILEQSIEGSWQNIYELKTGGNSGKQQRDSEGRPGVPEYHGEPKPTDAEIERNKKRLGELTTKITHGSH